ncbi:MAG: alpha-ribazole phosphatase [Parabacteroides sp.]
MEIYFVRHTSVAVPAGITYGQTDVPLNSTFQEEAEQVKKKLEGLTFDQVWTSPLSRCTRLANYCGYPEAIRDNRLKELSFGEWEMKSWDEISKDSRSEAWFANWIDTATPQGESFKDQFERVRHFIEEIRATTYQRICVFAHGGILTCARIYAGHYTFEEAFKQVPPYGGIIQIDF